MRENKPRLVITGQQPLSGSVRINGAKNACLPLMAASLLTDGDTVLSNVPHLTDVQIMSSILRALGMSVQRLSNGRVHLKTVTPDRCTCPHELAMAMRAGICVLGPLVARRGEALVPMPGGCVLGERPIDLHLKGLEALGATIRKENGLILATADRLKGAHIYLGGPRGSTCLGTANVMSAATLAKGTTTIEHAACEPEIKDLADYLNTCGARIEGAGTGTVTIEGVDRLMGCMHAAIPDRIEAGTFAAAAAITGGDILLEEVRPDHMAATIDVMQQMGVGFEVGQDTIRVWRSGPLRPVNVNALPYPGVPTDMQAQIMALLLTADGVSMVSDTVYPERFAHVAEFSRLGADITRQSSQAIVRGPARLTGAPVVARDLRGGAGLILAGLAAEGVTEVEDVSHIDRGYELIEERLAGLGADIARVGASPMAAGQTQLFPKRAAS